MHDYKLCIFLSSCKLVFDVLVSSSFYIAIKYSLKLKKTIILF